ncbi:hypothetical protein MXMO3_03504 (plasmid) [Maritalea myrionectae]|uniref:TraK N-terminal domain-containing protein n=1 Tax=Maritalea myrionectae TaxID=454601 RepID=A0A2R4MJ38_9HYPH|nr:type-F conjugative transfer system secretin TraK [Maritalea myrionectae]AVX06007.1 hypothetical protein MXMO3_03504 [Maritalea myrionectae]
MTRRLAQIWKFAAATMALVLVTGLIASVSTPALASQARVVEADGSVTFYASTTSVTRISIKDGRIRSIINDTTQFEMKNDEKTGDVFLRFSGEQAERESGFIVTEEGLTVSYTLIPKSGTVAPVILDVQSNQVTSGGDVSAQAFGTGSDDIALTMTDVIRSVANAHVIGVKPKGKNNKIYKSVIHGNWKAHILVAVADANGRLVKEQDFIKPKTAVRSVWIQNPSLGPNEATFVIVVEAK